MHPTPEQQEVNPRPEQELRHAWQAFVVVDVDAPVPDARVLLLLLPPLPVARELLLLPPVLLGAPQLA